jgi:hypothetical protein
MVEMGGRGSRFDEVASPGVHVAVSNPTLNLLGRH